MLEIKDLLLSFDKLLVKEEIKKSIICATLNKVIGLKLLPKDVNIKNNIIYLNIKPIYKNEIHIKKDILNEMLKKELGYKAPNDIR